MSNMQSGYFNEDTVVELAAVARSEGWDQMVSDAYLFVSRDCDWEDSEDRNNLVRALILEVGDKLKDR